MLKSANHVQGHKIRATDGEIGKVTDFLFNDEDWKVRYAVVDTSGWLDSKPPVLVSRAVMGPVKDEDQAIAVQLTRSTVEECPEIDTIPPVSLEKENQFQSRFGLGPYWWPTAPMHIPPAIPMSRSPSPQNGPQTETDTNEPTLRSALKVTGYHIQASNGEIGHVEDFILDDEAWVVRYLVIDTRNWLPGRKVLVAPHWIEKIRWTDSKVFVNLTQEQIRKSPEYDPSAPVNREYEQRLYDYYGRPAYWKEKGSTIQS